jgi:UDP-N-acetylmuramate: L-alanyl-gamma-D-glutamyl-meso-diaminopimelate ligase
MELERNLSDPLSVYRQSEDKQRVVITGNQAMTITAMVIHVLRNNHRDFDYVTSRPSNGSGPVKMSDAPLVIIEESKKPYALAPLYHHHIGLISSIDSFEEEIINVTRFADATPKAGILIFSELDPVGTIGKKQRADVTAIPYSRYLHKDENGKVTLITSTNEHFPIKISGEQNLQSISAAKEVLKKIGITSGQFYRSIGSFEN